MKDLDSLLDEADWATEDVPICLKGSLVKKFERADADLQQAQAEFDAAAGANLPTAAPAAERNARLDALKAIEAEMHDHEIVITLSQIEKATYTAIELDSQPPREGNRIDAMLGADTSKFYDKLLRACIVAPEMTEAQYTRLMSRITDLQFDRLASAAVKLNREMDGTIPFSYAASVLTLDSGETSSSPETSGSARGGSGAGPRKRAKRSGTASRGT